MVAILPGRTGGQPAGLPRRLAAPWWIGYDVPMPLASGNVPVQYMTLAGGFAGTDQTVALMRQLATGRYGSRSPKIRALAINILRQAGVPEKNYPAEMVALHNWVRDNIRYTRDVAGQETLSPPEEVAFNTKAGDCDDKSTLLAALLGSVGIPSRFKTIGVTPDRFSHVYLQAMPANQWISLDPIMRNKPAGWEAPAQMRKLERVYPENIPSQGLNMNGLGYVGDPRIVSFLEEEPAPAPRAPTPYVQMKSFLDNNAPIEQLSNNAPAFPQSQNIGPRMPKPRLQQVRPKLGRIGARLASATARQQQVEEVESELAVMQPGRGLNDVYLPEDLANLGAHNADEQEIPREYMQRPALAFTPDALDSQYGRAGLILNAKAGDRLVYRGLFAMNEQPPIRRLVGMGDAPQQLQPSGALPGMGEMATGTKTVIGLTALAVGIYLCMRKR